MSFQKMFQIDLALQKIVLSNVVYEVWIELKMDYAWFINRSYEEWPFDVTLFKPEYTIKFFQLKCVKYVKGLVETQVTYI